MPIQFTCRPALKSDMHKIRLGRIFRNVTTASVWTCMFSWKWTSLWQSDVDRQIFDIFFLLQKHCGVLATAPTKDPMLSPVTNAATDKEKYIYLWAITCSLLLHTINIYPNPVLLKRHSGACRERAATSAWFRLRISFKNILCSCWIFRTKTLIYSARGEQPMVSQLGQGDRSCAWWWTEH